MAFRSARRRLLSSLFFSMSAGCVAPFLSTGSTLASLYSRTAQKILQAPRFNPATDLQPLSSTRQNTYPIILVYGFAGFVTLGPLHYWGGVHNIQADLANNGYTACSAAMGPFSSNWDRACELFAQIKGGTVDYGQAHSSTYGHARYGRTFPGLYPQWGEINPQTGKVNKVHLIAHSMGGETTRVLAQLLAHGSMDEREATAQDQLSPLFMGEKVSWLDSILTISTPHNGTPADYFVQSSLPFLPQFITLLAALQGDHLLTGYDFMLDQWGLVRQPGESLSTYIDRVERSKFSTSNDGSGWDLNPDGAAELNDWAKAQPDLYYFSVGTLQTHEDPSSHHQVPDVDMNVLFRPTSTFIGKYTQNTPGHVFIDSSWWPNDGLVSTNAMAGPTIRSTDEIVPYSGTPVKGKWNYLDVMKGYGHIDVIGWGPHDVRPWFRNLAAFLASLPQ
jgi:triacylglycerol lipase